MVAAWPLLPPLLLLLAPTASRSEEAPPVPVPAPCPAAAIPHAVAGCGAGPPGAECAFACEAGYLAIGRHVCQSYTTTEGSTPISNEYYGGRCARLCENRDCAFAVAVRSRSTDERGPCLATRCVAQPGDALQQLARGAYSLWNLGRNTATGIHVGKVDPSAEPGVASQGGAIFRLCNARFQFTGARLSPQRRLGFRSRPHRHQRRGADDGVRGCRDGMDHASRGPGPSPALAPRAGVRGRTTAAVCSAVAC
jgi:hypothetical protein